MKLSSSFTFYFLITYLLLLQFPALANLNKGKEDYDSVIVSPREKAFKDDLYVIPLDKNSNKKLRIKELKKSRLFKLVEPNYKLYLDEINPKRNYIKINKLSEGYNPNLEEITPNDENFISQYYLKEINATKAWNTTIGDSLLVGVLDTGVDAKHPDLIGKIQSGFDLSEVDLTDEIGHGTEVAGIIAANTNNNEGIAGIAWNAKILPIRITDENGEASISNVVAALDKLYKNKVMIAQISLGTNQFSQVLSDAIQEAQNRGILIISTGGNSGNRQLRYPAAFPGVIGVGAVTESKYIESYSTTGPHITLVAPSSYIYTTSLYSNYATVTGTSFGAPQVAGTAALIWSVAPELTSDEVREILIESSEDLGEVGKDELYGYGLLNTQKAVEIAKAKHI